LGLGHGAELRNRGREGREVGAGKGRIVLVGFSFFREDRACARSCGSEGDRVREMGLAIRIFVGHRFFYRNRTERRTSRAGDNHL
jgi:hypothetical protein